MKTLPNAKEIGHLWFENVWNKRDQAKLHELMALDAIGYLEGGLEIVGPHAFLAFQSAFLEAIPDIHIEVVNSLSDEDDVCIHWTATGTHTGPGLGMPPTGQEVSFRGVTWLQTKNGQVVGGRDFWNQEKLMRTLSSPVVS
ncbi:MAG: ester cyclase [Verrucomicrobiota bacterium]